MAESEKYVRWLDKLTNDDVPLVTKSVASESPEVQTPKVQNLVSSCSNHCSILANHCS